MVKKKLNTSTLTTDAATPQKRFVVMTEMTSTPKM